MPLRRHKNHRSWAPCALAAVVALVGCYHGTARSVSPRDLTHDNGWVMVKGIRLIPQTTDRDCGAAALAMMLERWSPSSLDDILRGVPFEPSRGIPAGALRDFARQKGLRAFLIEGQLGDLVKEVGLNRPVLVGLVQRYGDRTRSHYEVVAGINQARKRVFLMDPAHGPREDSFDGFLAEWNAAGRPTLVIVPS